MFYQNWHQAGVNKLSSLVEGNKNRLLAFKEFLKKFSIKCNWLQYFGLTSAKLSECNNYLKEQNQASTINLPAIDKISCKTIHRLLIDNQDFSPPTTEKKLTEYGFSMDERQKIYSLPFLVTKEIKLSMFQYKIIHNILYTNAILYKMKKVQEPFCPYCTNVEQTVNLSNCSFLLVLAYSLVSVFIRGNSNSL